MSVNPFEYLSISKGTINLSGNNSSTEEDVESQDKIPDKKNYTSTSEEWYLQADFDDNFDDVIEMASQTREALVNQAKSAFENKLNANNLASATNYQSTSSITPLSNDFADKLNDKFKGALAGMGEIIVGAAQKYGLDPALLAAIMALETGWGTSSAVNNQNNPGGLMDPASNWMKLQSFSSIEEGIDAMAKNLKNGYIDKGLTTIAQIGNKYCPVGAANDPNGTNAGWIPSVTSIYNQFKA